MKKLSLIIASLVAVISISIAPVAVHAVDNFQPCAGVTDSLVCKSSSDTAQPLIKTVINTLIYLIGSVSVVMVIIGGLMYVLSTGNANNVTRAKNTITYALVGLAVAFLAFALINWVLGTFGASAQQQCVQKGGVYNAKTKTCSK